jgi:hypothetical protein
MFLYGILFFFGMTLTIIGVYERKYDKICYIFFSIPLIFLSGLRYGISSDYFAYLGIFENSTWLSFERINVEYGYFILNKMFSSMGLSLGALFVLTTSIVILNIYLALKNFNVNKICGLFIYFCLFYFINIFNLVRHGIAASFILYAFSLMVKNKTLKVIIILLISSLFHTISLVFLPIVLFSKYKFNIIFVLLTLIICYVLFVKIGLNIIIANIGIIKTGRAQSYLEWYGKNINTSTLGIGSLLFIIFFIIFSILRGRLISSDNGIRFNIAYNMIYFSILFLIVLWSIPNALERVLNITRQGIIILIPYSLTMLRNDKKIFVTMMIILICFVFYYQTMFLSDIPGKYAHFPYQWNWGYSE